MLVGALIMQPAFLSWQIHQHKKETITQLFLSKKLQQLRLSQQEFSQSQCNDHEVVFHDQYFDFVSYQIDHGTVILLGKYDTKEDKLASQLRKRKQARQIQNSSFFSFFYFQEREEIDFKHPLSKPKKKYAVYQSPLNKLYHRPITPPPKGSFYAFN